MAQALAEKVFPWHGHATVWPPRTALPGSISYEVEGTILSHYALNVRKANEQTGFLKQTVTNDVNFKYRALQIKVQSAKELPSGKAVTPAELPKVFDRFVQLSTGAAAPTVTNGELTFWADAQVQSDLSAKIDGKPVELTRAYVRLQTEGSTLIVKSIDLVSQAAENKFAPKLEDQPNLFAGAQNKFNPAAAAAVAKNQAPKKGDDDDWDD
jgi:hypothetical protein